MLGHIPQQRSNSHRHLHLYRLTLLIVTLRTATYNPHALHGLYAGPTSLAYLFYHISNTQPRLSIRGKSPGHWCEAYLDSHRPETAPTPSSCGIINETLAHLAVSAAAYPANESFVTAFLGFIPEIVSSTSHGKKAAANEWLYGRAGTLYLLRLLRTSTSNSHLDGKIDAAIAAIVEKISSEGPPWPWHEKEYLGAVHGTIGIVTQIILSEPARVGELVKVVEGLLDLQIQETGNWPSSAGKERDELVQICHGAPGYVLFFPLFPFPPCPYRCCLGCEISCALYPGIAPFPLHI